MSEKEQNELIKYICDFCNYSTFKKNNYDTRTTALSKKSKLFFEHLNLWQHVKPFTCMIKNIMVNDGDPEKNI